MKFLIYNHVQKLWQVSGVAQILMILTFGRNENKCYWEGWNHLETFQFVLHVLEQENSRRSQVDV